MKKLLSILILFCSFTAFSQTKTTTSFATTPSPVANHYSYSNNGLWIARNLFLPYYATSDTTAFLGLDSDGNVVKRSFSPFLSTSFFNFLNNPIHFLNEVTVDGDAWFDNSIHVNNSAGVILPNIANVSGDIATITPTKAIAYRTTSQILSDIGAYSPLDTGRSLSKLVTGGTLNKVKDSVSILISLYQPLIAPGSTSDYWRGDKTWQTLNKSAVGLSNVDNTSDLSKPISTAIQTALNNKEPLITSGSSAQYIKGDKSLGTFPVNVSSFTNDLNYYKPSDTGRSISKIVTGGSLNKVRDSILANIPVSASDSIQTYTTGTGVSISNGINVLYVNPASVRSVLTITLPAIPSSNKEISIYFGGTMTSGTVVTSITISPNTGQSLLQSTTPTSVEAGESLIFHWNSSNSIWYRKF